jgi:hypothetical protein
MTGHFRKITVSGSPEEIGLQHGKLLSEQIHQNIEFNKPITLSNLDDKPEIMILKGNYRIRPPCLAY